MDVPREYLVNYGRAGYLGRFVNACGGTFARDERVVVQSARGIEAGVVLGETSAQFAHLVGVPAGDLLRPATSDDVRTEQSNHARSARLIQEAQSAADSLKLQLLVLDAEVMLESERAILHLLPFADCDPTPLRERLNQQCGLEVTFLDSRTGPEPEAIGCGKPGCGSEKGSCSDCGSGGGCSTGSCSSGKVKNAQEMTDYFVQLRQKMEREFGRVPLHR